MGRVETIKDKYGEDAFRRFGSSSWKNPGRSRAVGFALKDTEEVKRLGAEGGKRGGKRSKIKSEEAVADEQAGEEGLASIQPLD